jgi:hypothetical protein
MAGLRPTSPEEKAANKTQAQKMLEGVNGLWSNMQGAVAGGSPAATPTPATVPASNAAAPTPAPTPQTPRPVSSVVPPIVTTTGATDAARSQVMESLGMGEKLGKELYAPGSFGRVEVPRQAETKALISAQEQRLRGLTPQEQEAARTNALLSINQQANTRLKAIGNKAAGNGLRGGVVAGEQAEVAGGAQSAYASALQELMGRVQKSQVDASNELGNTLTSARGNEQSAQGTNINAAMGELSGRLSTPFDYANAVDTATTSDRIETNAATVDLEKGNDIRDKVRDAEQNLEDIEEEAYEDKLKTGGPADDFPVNAYARANGVSTFEDLPPETQAEYYAAFEPLHVANGDSKALQEAMKSDRGKAIADSLVAEARKRRRQA